MATLLDEAINAGKNNNVEQMPKFLPLSTAQNIETVSAINQRKYAPDYKVNTAERLATGAAYAVAEMADAVPALQLYGEEAQLAIGGYFGAKEDFIERKKLNIATLQRNLVAQQQNRMQGISEETANSWAFGIGQGLTNFALMYATGGAASGGAKALLGASTKTAVKVGAAAGIASAVPLENIEQQSDRIKFDKEGNVDTSNITPEWARKTVGGEAFYMAGMGILEAKFGLFKNLSQWQKPVPFKNKLLKNLSVPTATALKSFINEGGTEGLQSLLSSGIQLAEGNITMADMPEKLQQAWKEAIIGGLLGGTAGTAVAINQAHNVKTMLNEEISKVVTDPEECEKVVDAIYDSGTLEMTNVISKELELSSELNTKHGAIYDSMQAAIFDAINNAGAFEGIEEAEIAQYVSDTSKMFANQVLAEANKRGVLIDEVLKAGDIKFENGKIRLQAGKDVIAEVPIVQEEVTAEIINNEEIAQDEKPIPRDIEWENYLKKRDEISKAILFNAAQSKFGKQFGKKEFNMLLGAAIKGKQYKNKGFNNRVQKFLDRILQPDDRITEGGLDTSWAEYGYSGEDDYSLAEKAFRDLTENRTRPLSPEEEYGLYIEEITNKIIDKFNNAKTIEELNDLYDNELSNLSLSNIDNEYIANKATQSFVENIERLENGKNIGNRETQGNRESTSKSNFRTIQNSNGGISQKSIDGEQGQTQNQQINPDELYQTDVNENFKKWSDNAPLVTSEEALNYDFKTGKKVVVEAFHGTKRGDRVGSIFRADRATSGPMAFFSSNREISENYAKGKEDTSLSDDMQDYDQWFKIKINGRSIPLKDAWWNLPSQKRQEISEKAPHITEDEEGGIVYDENNNRGVGNYDYEIKRYRGNALRTLVEGWLMGGTLYGREDDFLKVLELAGINREDIDYIDPYTDHSKVYDVYLSLKNPLVTNDIPKKVLTQLNKESKKQPIPEVGWGVDTWDKTTRNPIEWIEQLKEDYANNENSHVWTSIPDWVTDVLKGFGYDGIIDMGGKSGGEIHKVYIPFKSTQIKSVDNQGTFDENNPDIYLQLKGNPKEPKKYRGAYDVSAKAIELFKDADYSTLPHELAHFWLDNMWQFSKSGKASEAYMNNFKGVLDWLGVKDNQINLTRAQQEKFARGYEKYLYNGYAPNGLIQGAFDDYDKWLQKVYNDARELKVKLNADAIAFFDSMTTGELLDYDIPETQAEIRQKNIEQVNKDIEQTKKVIVEKQAQFNSYDGGNVITKDTVPVTTEGEKKQSRAYTKQAAILGIAEELNYNKADIAEQNQKAAEFVKNNLDDARLIVTGQKEAPSDILKNAIYNAYLKEMLNIGDNEAYLEALRNQSLELTRAGQEIASQRGAIENIFDSGYWIRRIENLKKMRLAANKFGGVTGAETEQALSKMNTFIKNKVDEVLPEFIEADSEQQKKIAEKLSKDIAAEFKVKPDSDTLYQSMKEPSELRTKTNAYNYIYRYINKALGIELTPQQANEIIGKTNSIQKSIETTRNRNGNPSALFFKNISEMEAYANSIEPSPALAILTSTVGRGNMLFSPKTILLNIESNIINFLTEGVTRRIANQAVNTAVDNQVIKDYLAYSREVFNTSGYQVSSMPTLDPTTQILSEKMTTTAGKGIVNSLGRFFEQTIFKYGLGYPDLYFKDMTFVDTANLLATKEAKGDSKKATELFKDICLIEPKTAAGKRLREIAINEALVATYQNKGKTSELALNIRNAINKASGSLNLGDMLSPFVKTPANVIGLGFDYSMGGLLALRNIKTIYNDIQNGTFTDVTRQSVRSLARNGIGFVAAMLIASMIDDDDYIPEYALLDARERELVKMKGGVFNSVKIGDKYVSLDYFGPLGMPLVAILNARRGNDVKEKAWNYFQGSGYQALKLPVIGDLKSLLEGTGRTLTKDFQTNFKTLEDASIDFLSSRSIPAIVTDIAKITDRYERETNNDAIKRLQSKLPVVRESLPTQYNYGTGKPRETQNPINILLAGARVKDEISSPVIKEINKLSKKNTEEKIGLSKVTKSGKLSELTETQKNKAEKEFAQKYASAVNQLIQTNKYSALDSNDKIKAINKVRDAVREEIKIEYGLAKPKKRKRSK